MNILQISTYDIKGGAAKVAWTIKEQLEQRDNITSMFVGHKLSSASNVYQIPNSNLRRFLSVAFASDLDFFQSDAILQTEQYRKADIVHYHNLHGYYFNLATLQKMAQEKPVIWTLHDMWAVTAHCAHAFDGRLKGGFYQCPSRNIYPSILWPNETYLQGRKKTIYKSISFEVVVPSKWLAQKVKASVLGNQHISLIYNGIDTSIFYRYDMREMRKKLNLPLNNKIILFITDGWKRAIWKGYNYLFRIMRLYEDNKNVLFIVIGGDKFHAQYAGKNFHQLLFVRDQALLAEYYSASDMLLMTSIAENFPLTMLEAMACGLPVVSFDVGGVKEAVIHKRNGYIAKYKDVPDIIRGMNYILNLDADSLKRMSKDSISRVKQEFTVDTMTKRYVQLYTSLLRT